MAHAVPAPGRPRRRRGLLPGDAFGRAFRLAAAGRPTPAGHAKPPRHRPRYRYSNRHSGATEPDQLSARGELPDQAAEASELSERLRKAIAELPEKQAQAFCVYYLEGWDYQQIAGHQAGTVNAVGVL